MRTLIVFIGFILFSNISYSQDKITTKEGTNLKVKIIYIDSENIYFYQTLDSDKNIRKVNKKYISGYEYNSIENGKNKTVIASDSTLFANYLKNTKGVNESTVISYDNISTNINDSILNSNIQETTNELPMVLPLVNQRFQKAGKQMIVSSTLILASAIITILSSNIEKPNYSKQSEVNTYNDKIKNMQYASAICALGSWGFTLGAGINIYNGALLLK